VPSFADANVRSTTLMRRSHPEAFMTTHAWMTVEQAAALLSLPVVTLRRKLERNARPTANGGTAACVDGITARKLGRLWRVWLDPGWLTPTVLK
jgi:hypothetical protein